jgi:hypothetical protein
VRHEGYVRLLVFLAADADGWISVVESESDITLA